MDTPPSVSWAGMVSCPVSASNTVSVSPSTNRDTKAISPSQSGAVGVNMKSSPSSSTSTASGLMVKDVLHATVSHSFWLTFRVMTVGKVSWKYCEISPSG